MRQKLAMHERRNTVLFSGLRALGQLASLFYAAHAIGKSTFVAKSAVAMLKNWRSLLPKAFAVANFL